LLDGKSMPEFAHLPMILGATRADVEAPRRGDVMQYMRKAPAEALDNYLARLGWSHGERKSSPEAAGGMVRPRARQRSPAKFDPEKALWMNQQYLKHADDVGSPA